MFISLEETLNLTSNEVRHIFKKNINPGLFKTFKVLGYDQLVVTKAVGSYIYTEDRRILDYSSACGITALGHNPPQIIEAEQFCHKHKIVDALKFGISPLQAALAMNIAHLLPECLDTCFFAVSGAEANEAAMKIAMRRKKHIDSYFIRMSESFHGKTHGALSLTSSENFSEGFHLGFPESRIITVSFNDSDQLREAFHTHKSKIAGIIIEPIQGQNINVATKDYMRTAKTLCEKYDSLLICDEVKVGLGRSGELFSFFKYDICPDILTTSKALGGGKQAISAMVTSRAIYKQAYGSPTDSTLHSTTFGGMGEACAAAINLLHTVSQKDFLLEVVKKSAYFRGKLENIREKYHNMILKIKGEGLYLGIEFRPMKAQSFLAGSSEIKNKISIFFSALIVNKMLNGYDILTFFTGTQSHVLHVLPPLNTTYTEIDYFCDSLDDLLGELDKLDTVKFLFSALKSLK